MTRSSALWSAAVLAVTLTSANAADVATTGCHGTTWWMPYSCVTVWGTLIDPYVRTVPQPSDDAARKRASDRDHKWVDRCKPVIKRDQYGVSRYQYSAPGCEFGVEESN